MKINYYYMKTLLLIINFQYKNFLYKIVVKKIKENTQKLKDLMSKIIIEFDPPKENYLCNDENIDVNILEKNNEGNYNFSGQKGDKKTFLEGYSSFDQNNNSESQKNEDN